MKEKRKYGDAMQEWDTSDTGSQKTLVTRVFSNTEQQQQSSQKPMYFGRLLRGRLERASTMRDTELSEVCGRTV